MLQPKSKTAFTASSVKSRLNRGFTLIELMIVIAIVGIIFAMTFPAVSRMIVNHHADSLVSELELDIQFARNLAITNTNPIFVLPLGGDWNNGWLIRDNFTNALQRQRGSIDRPIAEWGGIVSSYTTGAPLIFNALGRSDTPGQFVINVPGSACNRQARIQIQSLGQIVIRRVSNC